MKFFRQTAATVAAAVVAADVVAAAVATTLTFIHLNGLMLWPKRFCFTLPFPFVPVWGCEPDGTCICRKNRGY